MSEDFVKRLAEAKSYLETKLVELENEVSTLRSILTAFDEVLAEKSFKKVKVERRHIEAEPPSPVVPEEKFELTTVDGILLGELSVKDNDLLLAPAQGISLRVDLPPFVSFLINRVLEPIRRKDEEAVASGALRSDEAFNYEIDEDSGILNGIRMINYGDSKRLNEFKNAIRWTLRRLYEKGT